MSPLINAANFLETGSFWDMRKCAAGSNPEVSDREQITVPPVVPEQDALFGAIAGLYLPIKLPLYASGPHCNALGLSNLGDYTIAQMAKRKMLFDPDHMSVKARKASLNLTEKLKYPGVVSSHSWSTPDAYPRIYKAGGVVTPYAGDSKGFVAKWRQHLKWADRRYYFGFGYGADINVDGVAHYGLYPDWIEDLRRQGGQAIADDMARGAEAYLTMWERAVGVSNDACRDPRAIKSTKTVKVRHGKKVRKVKKVKKVTRTVTFTTSGKIAKVR